MIKKSIVQKVGLYLRLAKNIYDASVEVGALGDIGSSSRNLGVIEIAKMIQQEDLLAEETSGSTYHGVLPPRPEIDCKSERP